MGRVINGAAPAGAGEAHLPAVKRCRRCLDRREEQIRSPAWCRCHRDQALCRLLSKTLREPQVEVPQAHQADDVCAWTALLALKQLTHTGGTFKECDESTGHRFLRSVGGNVRRMNEHRAYPDAVRHRSAPRAARGARPRNLQVDRRNDRRCKALRAITPDHNFAGQAAASSVDSKMLSNTRRPSVPPSAIS